MQYGSVKVLLRPLIKAGQDWQYISINGDETKPKFYFSNVQWVIIVLSILILFKLNRGVSKDVIGYVMSAFAISVSLLMSLLVSIFEKFENNNFDTTGKSDEQVKRLIQKKNFFKRFISITSYLVVLSVVIIVLCSLNYIFNSFTTDISIAGLASKWKDVDIKLTIGNCLILCYRVILNYFLLDYLFLILFVTGSSFEYFMSEMNREKVIYRP